MFRRFQSRTHLYGGRKTKTKPNCFFMNETEINTIKLTAPGGIKHQGHRVVKLLHNFIANYNIYTFLSQYYIDLRVVVVENLLFFSIFI